MTFDETLDSSYPIFFGNSIVIPLPILRSWWHESNEIIEILSTLEIIINNEGDLPILNKDGYLADDILCLFHTTSIDKPIPYLHLSDGSGCYYLDIYRKETYLVETFSGTYNVLEQHDTLQIRESLGKWRDFLVKNGR